MNNMSEGHTSDAACDTYEKYIHHVVCGTSHDEVTPVSPPRCAIQARAGEEVLPDASAFTFAHAQLLALTSCTDAHEPDCDLSQKTEHVAGKTHTEMHLLHHVLAKCNAQLHWVISCKVLRLCFCT